MTGKWGEFQGKLDLVRVSEEFELSDRVIGFYCITARQSRVNSAKILNSSIRTKCPVKFFNRSKIRPVRCERGLMQHQETFSTRKRI